MIKILFLPIILLAATLTACLPVAYMTADTAAIMPLIEQSVEPTPSPIPESPPQPTSTPTPTPPPTLTAKLMAVGDLMLHQAQVDDAYERNTGEYDFDKAFSVIAPYLSDGYAIGNLETVFDGGPFRDFPMFNAPDEFGLAIGRAGFNLLSTANNHSNDRHTKGILRTIEVLDELGIDHVGSYASQEERDEIFVKDIDGITFAFLAYTYGLNGLPLERGREYMVNIINENYMLDDIRRARESGADFVVVLPHMGNEYELQPRQVFKNWIKLMMDAGADIVLASHPHVLQSAEFIELDDGREGFVVYSLGNFVSGQRTHPRDAGVIANLYFEKPPGEQARIAKVEFVPTWVQFRNNSGASDIKILPVADTLRAVEEGEEHNLRPQDINRMKNVWRDAVNIYGDWTAGLELEGK